MTAPLLHESDHPTVGSPFAPVAQDDPDDRRRPAGVARIVDKGPEATGRSRSVKPVDVHRLREQLELLSADVRLQQRAILRTWSGSGWPEADGRLANLAAYLAFRQTDVGRLQGRLARAGLSSLGRTESHVRASLAAVTSAAAALDGEPPSSRHVERVARLQSDEARKLDSQTQPLFGAAPAGRRTRIMVTLGADLAADPERMRALVVSGMDCARINTAHDGPEVWLALEAQVRLAGEAEGRACRVLFDLPGPKLRIAPMFTRPATVKVTGSDRGRAGATGAVILRAAGGDAPVEPEAPVLDVDAAWLETLAGGDVLDVVDSRGRARTLTVDERIAPDAVRCLASRTIRFAEGTTVTRLPRRPGEMPAVTMVGALAPAPAELPVVVGDRIRLNRSVGDASTSSSVDGLPLIACQQPGVVEQLSPGQGVRVDDGHLDCVVEAVDEAGAILRVVKTRGERVRLRADQGLNFPGLQLRDAAPTPGDLEILDVVGAHADLVGLSFCESPDDVARLRDALDARGLGRVGLIAKVETRRSVEELPRIVAAAVSRGPFGVMIARGDLAVEIGYERLAEIQEELLWLCEAAHVPVIWATQVLEAQVKTGIPTRAEVTDAAMAERAECVMLNKGPHIVEAVGTLVDVIARMETHQRKKMTRLRRLRTWSGASGPSSEG